MTSRTLLTLLLPTLLIAPAALPSGATAQTAPKATQAAQDFSSPEAAIRSFALAVNALDVRGADAVVGGKIDADLRGWAQDARKTKEGYRITIVSVQPQVDGDGATAAVTFEVKSNAKPSRLEESLSLRKVGAEWKIVPPTEAEFGGYFKILDKDPPLLSFLAGVYRYPKRFLTTRDAGREALCRSNLEQLAQAALTYTQDYDDKFALRADAWKTALKPYVKSNGSFYCLSDETDQPAYSFNAQLQGKPVDALRKPELTVLIYEGKKGVLAFRHHGRATVALANGKARLVTPAEARSLRWAP